MHALFFLPLYIGLSFTAKFERTQEFRVIDASTNQPLADVRVKHMVINDDMLFSRGSADYILGPTGRDGTVAASHVPIGPAHSFLRFSRAGYADSTIQINGDLLPDVMLGSPADNADPLKRVKYRATIEVPLHRRDRPPGGDGTPDSGQRKGK
jgi:hypothetical protein